MRRVFPIAMTAWSAKVRANSICRSLNGSTRWRTAQTLKAIRAKIRSERCASR
jgi:hypothetical protein